MQSEKAAVAQKQQQQAKCIQSGFQKFQRIWWKTQKQQLGWRHIVAKSVKFIQSGFLCIYVRTQSSRSSKLYYKNRYLHFFKWQRSLLNLRCLYIQQQQQHWRHSMAKAVTKAVTWFLCIHAQSSRSSKVSYEKPHCWWNKGKGSEKAFSEGVRHIAISSSLNNYSERKKLLHLNEKLYFTLYGTGSGKGKKSEIKLDFKPCRKPFKTKLISYPDFIKNYVKYKVCNERNYNFMAFWIYQTFHSVLTKSTRS